MAADEDEHDASPALVLRHTIASIPVLCGCAIAIAVEIMVLFGLWSPGWWHIFAVSFVVAGVVLGWIADARREQSDVAANRIALASLLVSVVALVVAVLAFLFPPIPSP